MSYTHHHEAQPAGCVLAAWAIPDEQMGWPEQELLLTAERRAAVYWVPTRLPPWGRQAANLAATRSSRQGLAKAKHARKWLIRHHPSPSVVPLRPCSDVIGPECGPNTRSKQGRVICVCDV